MIRAAHDTPSATNPYSEGNDSWYETGVTKVTRVVPAAWTVAIEEFDQALKAGGALPSTRQTRRDHLRHLARHIGEQTPWTMTDKQLLDFCGRQSWLRETRRGRRNTFLAFFAWGHAAGKINANLATSLPKVRATTPAPRPAPMIAYQHALARAGERERLMLRLAAETGMRRAEVAAAHSRDLISDLHGHSVLVRGKGERQRVIPISKSLAAAIKSKGPGYLFPGRVDGHLSPRWVGTLISRLLTESTMHQLRHQFATRFYDVSRDLLATQQVLGHASPATTQRYVALASDVARRTIDTLCA